MKLKVGDKVRILDGRLMSDPNGVSWVEDGMRPLVGLETTVTYVFSRSVCLNIDQRTYSWAEYWLEKIED